MYAKWLSNKNKIESCIPKEVSTMSTAETRKIRGNALELDTLTRLKVMQSQKNINCFSVLPNTGCCKNIVSLNCLISWEVYRDIRINIRYFFFNQTWQNTISPKKTSRHPCLYSSGRYRNPYEFLRYRTTFFLNIPLTKFFVVVPCLTMITKVIFL